MMITEEALAEHHNRLADFIGDEARRLEVGVEAMCCGVTYAAVCMVYVGIPPDDRPAFRRQLWEQLTEALDGIGDYYEGDDG